MSRPQKNISQHVSDYMIFYFISTFFISKTLFELNYLSNFFAFQNFNSVSELVTAIKIVSLLSIGFTMTLIAGMEATSLKITNNKKIKKRRIVMALSITVQTILVSVYLVYSYYTLLTPLILALYFILYALWIALYFNSTSIDSANWSKMNKGFQIKSIVVLISTVLLYTLPSYIGYRILLPHTTFSPAKYKPFDEEAFAQASSVAVSWMIITTIILFFVLLYIYKITIVKDLRKFKARSI